jgi:tetratricopeptide (TPR) repeat protein
MKKHPLFPLFPFFIPAALVPCAIPQTTNSTQKAALKSKSESPKWTEADEKRLLAKAKLGDADAQMWLGAAYEQGWFGNANFTEALKWFRKSAEQGNPDAQNSLGQMYEDGEGVIQNYSLAAKWYRKAAEHVPDLGGAGQGRNNLGMLYLSGQGVPRDYVQAFLWLKLSGFESKNLSVAKAHMTPEEILEAERLAADWKREHECRVQDLLACLKPNDPAYVEAMELAQVLRNRGFIVKCVLQSTMIRFFEGETGAALYRTDRGDFEGLFLTKEQTFAVQPIETRTNGRYVYSFAGSPRRTGGLLDSARPTFFVQYENQFLTTWDKQLAADLQKAVASHPAR